MILHLHYVILLNGYTSSLPNIAQIILYRVLYKAPKTSFRYIINYNHYNFFECDWWMNSPIFHQ